MTLEEQVKSKVAEIQQALRTREVSDGEYEKMMVELHAIPGEQQASERHNEDECVFCQETVNEKMDEAILDHRGSGKKIERFRGIAI